MPHFYLLKMFKYIFDFLSPDIVLTSSLVTLNVQGSNLRKTTQTIQEEINQ
jgi:hypothetical protein